LNTQRVNFRVTGEFDSINITNLGFKLSNFHQDKSVENTYFGEVDFNSKDYQRSITDLEEVNGVISVFPHFQKNKDKSIGTSDLFYIKLKDTSDLSLLESEIQIDVSGYIPGAYKVILYSDGNMVETKNLLIN